MPADAHAATITYTLETAAGLDHAAPGEKAMTRKPTIEHDATSVVIRIDGASVRMRPSEADEFADRVKAEAAELRSASTGGLANHRTAILIAVAILAGLVAAYFTATLPSARP
jgi:hypothetical protein